MKKKYYSPFLEVQCIECKDILTLSINGGFNDGNWEVGEAPILE